jgi:hypothetical protein
MPNYPNSTPVFPAPSAGSYLNSPNHLTAHTQITDELSSIIGEVGLNPRGADITVKARLDRIDSSLPTKSTQIQAEDAADDTTFVTPLQVKNEVQKAGAVAIPIKASFHFKKKKGASAVR